MRYRFFDSETCGLVGIPVLFQYAIDDGPIKLHHIFDEPVESTLSLIEEMTKDVVVVFNLVFDWFHVNKLYNCLALVSDKSRKPEIEELFRIESTNPRNWCVKSAGSLDLYLHALKGPYQSVMDRKPLKIRRIPRALAEELIRILNDKVKFRKLFFARSETKDGGWEINECNPKEETLVDLVLRFRPSAGLKILCADAFNIDTTLLSEINELPYHYEESWRPYGWDWRPVINEHIKYWKTDSRAIKYATDDIVYLRKLYNYFNRPTPNDDDSLLAACVGAIRWSGYPVNKERMEQLLPIYESRIEGVPQSPNEVKEYLRQFLSPVEQLSLVSTKKQVLEEYETWESDEHDESNESGDFIRPDTKDIGELIKWKTDQGIIHPVAEAAHRVLQARRAKKRIDIISKLITTSRIHPDFRIIGAKSGRMSGSGGINPQGIPREKEFRSLFTFADTNYSNDPRDIVDYNPDGSFSLIESFDGGDFESFEISIADAVYNDPVMRAELLSGKKFHAMFGSQMYGLTYDDVKNDKEKYTKSKNGVFALLYGAQPQKLESTMGISLESAEEGYQRFIKKYEQVGRKRAEIINMFCSMTQPDGLGTKVIWKDPADYIETLLGFRRYFTLENEVCKSLFNLANDLPDSIKQLKIKVKRRDRYQTGAGAVCSALYGAAFNIQAANMRAAANHVIQGTGSGITKDVQASIWKLQPVGIHIFIVKPMNIHDEIMCPNKNKDRVKDTVNSRVEHYRPLVPLIGLTWQQGMNNWSEKS